MLAAVIRHVAFEDLGSFEQAFIHLGYQTAYYEAGVDDLKSLKKADLLVILGGPISVNDENRYPFLLDEFELVEWRIQNQKKTLGICLGAQVIAKVMGAKVYPAKEKEIGWKPIVLAQEGKKSPLEVFENIKLFHWHGETFDLPKGSALLASTSVCPHQAFSVSSHTLALQFHPEVTAKPLEKWYIGHTNELTRYPDSFLSQLRNEAESLAPLLAQKALPFLSNWLID